MNARASLPLLTLAALLGGCVKQSATLEIYEACLPPTPGTGGTCTYPTGSCTAVPLGTYSLDVAAATDFFVGVEVHNQLTDNASGATGGGNTHNAYIDSYSVTYSGANGVAGTSGSIQNTVPAGGSSVVGVLLADSSAIGAMAAQIPAGGALHVVASLTLKGKWGDQSKFETAPRTFGIDVCSGCYVPPTCDGGKQAFVCPTVGIWPSTFSCGGSAGGTTFTLGGTVLGLTNGTLVVSCSGLADLIISNSGSFTFSGGLTDGASYLCSINTTASTTTNNCSFVSGSNTGTVSGANVSSLAIHCL